MRATPIVLAIGLVTGAAATAALRSEDPPGATLARATAGLVAGKSQTCLPTRNTAQLLADGPNLIYRVSASQVYVSKTAGGCERIADGDALVTVSNQGRLCSGDLARTVDPVARFPTGNCALGDFTPYTRPRS